MDPDFRRDDGGCVKKNERVVMAAAASALFVAAVLLRTLGMMHEPFWLDEAYSAYAAGKGWAFLWQVVPRYETHPPFYYSLLRLWTLAFGGSLPAMRALGIACGIATLPVMLLCAREIARVAGLDARRKRRLALAVLALAALSPPLVEMAREVRPYPLLILAYAAGLCAVLRLGRRAAAGAAVRGRALALYFLVQALLLWLHNLGPLFAVALGLAMLVLVLRRSLGRADWLRLVGGHLVVGLIYLPALAILRDQAPTWIRSTWLHFDLAVAWPRLAALYALPGALALLAAAVLAGAALIALGRDRERRRVAAALLLTALVPVMLSLLLSALVAPVFILRTMTPVVVPSILLLGYGAIAPRGVWRWPVLGALLVLAVQMAAVDWQARHRPPQQDWYGVVRWLAARHRPGDVILAYPNEGALPFDRAVGDLRLALPSRPIPTAVPSLDVGGWNPTGSRGVVSLSGARLRAIARESSIRGAPTVWLLRLGPWAYDKGDLFLDALRVGRRPIAWWRSDYPDQPIDLVGLRLNAPRAARAAAAAAR